MVLKCKICAGDLAFERGDKIAVCEYCGRKQTLPQIDNDEKTVVLYKRANGYRIASEFDKAANIYNQIIAENKRDSEAYWNLALCNYGVIYVQDPKSNEYIPTCNRTHFSSILHDQNYKDAIKHASPEQQAIFEKDARYIDGVQKSILSIARHEKPFDIFICYKETTPDGRRTNDSIKAQNLYDKLTGFGYKVFFSRITLESKIGAEYEPYIYAALASSKVMIHITSSRENSNAVWVKNEWSRYISFAAKDSSKSLIPIYFDMDKGMLPDEFSNIPSYDIQKEGFEQELIRGIKKLIPTPVMKLQRKKKRNKILRWVSLVLAICLVAGTAYAIPKIKAYNQTNVKYNAAMQLYYDRNYPEAAWAFDALETFKDAEEMKDVAERSWRHSLATVATDNILGSSSRGAYYITANGTIETFDFDPGSSNNEIDINTHGKIVSLGSAGSLYALYEDGYVGNAAGNNKLQDDSEWHDIVQISPVFNTTNVALRADGKILYGDIRNEYNEDDTDLWLEGISTWNSIVAFDYFVERFGYGGLTSAAIVGLKSDGTLCAVGIFDVSYASGHLTTESVLAEESVRDFTNVKDFACTIVGNQLDVVALTTDGKLQMYVDGAFSEQEVADAIDVYIKTDYTEDDNMREYSEIYLLMSNGDFKKYESNKTLLPDVCYLKDGFFVTRTGSVYYSEFGKERPTATEGKTRVFDEWTERMN